MSAKTRKKTYKTYEDAVARLEEITDQLEAGEAGLDESIALYTEGLEIARFCDAKLSEAEKTIVQITKENDFVTEVPLDEADNS